MDGETTSHAAPNLLTSLHKWAWRQEENFLSEAFAHLLRHLKTHEPETAAAVIRVLAGRQFEIDANLVRFADIVTQVRLANRRVPDLWIDNQHDGYLLYIEVKHRHHDTKGELLKKLVSYIEDLKMQPGRPRRCVSLLSRYAQPSEALPVGDHYFAGQVQWYRIADLLQQQSPRSDQTISAFLACEFVNLLKEKGMTLEQVGTDLVAGSKSVEHLFRLIQHSLASASFSPRPEAPKENYGTYLGYMGSSKRRSFTVGFRLLDASKLWFEIQARGSRTRIPEGWQQTDDGWVGTGLDLVKEKFFSLPVDSQCKLIATFVDECLDELRHDGKSRSHKNSSRT